MLDKTQSTAAYAAYAELESAAEAFYAAADKMAAIVPELKGMLGETCDNVNHFVAIADAELDEVV